MSSKKNALDKNRSRETLKRILKYISQYKWSVILSLLLAFITVALTLYVPILTGRVYRRICDIFAQGHYNRCRFD